ncbi:MAG: hypothetical protein AAF799_35765 [Myxococcota bacterium]
MRLSLTLLISACLLAPASGCAHRKTPVVEVPEAPPAIGDLDAFEQELNRYALLPIDHPSREGYRQALSTFLVDYLGKALEADNEAEAHTALDFTLGLYTPTELRRAKPDAALTSAAEQLYRRSARHGAEMPSLFALAVIQRFGDDAAREDALSRWEELERWLVDNGPFSTEPLLAHEELERALETIAASFPTPFVVQRLSDLYVARYEQAKEAHAAGGGLGTTSQQRIDITGYLLMRLYLRADDPNGALTAMDRVESSAPVRQLRDTVDKAFNSRRSAQRLLSLADKLRPEPDADPGLPYVTQSWGIIHNLSRRALQAHPKDPFVHLMRAEALRQDGLVAAALHHLRRSLELKDDVYETWETLAQLEQVELDELAHTDADAALVRLAEVEALHQRAMKLWSDRPIRPGLPEAYFTVAEGLYQAGRVDDAEALLDKSLAIEAQPHALDLLGTIAFKRAQFGAAQAHYEDLARLPYEGTSTKLRWEARARGQLGEIALRRGDSEASTAHFRVALRQTNELLTQPTNTVETQANRILERGRLLFFLGEVELATQDFEYAHELEPGFTRAYAEPMLQLVSHGYYYEAVEIFRRAMDRGDVPRDLKLYFSLWLNDLALRQGRTPDTVAAAFLHDYEGKGWGSMLARHARGEVDYPALLDGAGDAGQRAEAFFYEGLRRWRAGDPEGAKDLLQKVLDSGLMGFFEYDMAQTYLGWGELPADARSPGMGGVAQH